MKINFSHIDQLQEWGFFPNNDNYRITVDDLEGIEEKFDSLSELHKQGLQIKYGIQNSIGNCTIDKKQLKTLIENKIPINDYKLLSEEASTWLDLGAIKKLRELGYELDADNIRYLKKRSPNIFEIRKLNKTVGHNVSLSRILAPSDFPFPVLNCCRNMKNFDHKGVKRLIKHNISVPDSKLALFKNKKVNRESFQVFVDNGIKYPEDSERFEYIQEGKFHLPDVLWIYKHNHPGDDPYDFISQHYGTNFSWEPKELVKHYREIEKTVQNKKN